MRNRKGWLLYNILVDTVQYSIQYIQYSASMTTRNKCDITVCYCF
jgi:hypothetical protein